MLHILYRATLRGTDASVRRVQAPVQQVVQTQLVTRDKQEETKTSGGKRRIMPKVLHICPYCTMLHSSVLTAKRLYPYCIMLPFSVLNAPPKLLLCDATLFGTGN